MYCIGTVIPCYEEDSTRNGAAGGLAAHNKFIITSGILFSPLAGGEALFQFPPQTFRSGGEIKISPPALQIRGGTKVDFPEEK